MSFYLKRDKEKRASYEGSETDPTNTSLRHFELNPACSSSAFTSFSAAGFDLKSRHQHWPGSNGPPAFNSKSPVESVYQAKTSQGAFNSKSGLACFSNQILDQLRVQPISTLSSSTLFKKNQLFFPSEPVIIEAVSI